MTLLSAQAVAKSFAGRDLFRDVSFDLAAGMRLAVVGPNGAGKSTLLRIMVGESEPDTGRVIQGRGLRVGYAAQDLSDLALSAPLLPWVLSALPSWSALWAEWEAAAQAADQRTLADLAARQAEQEAAFGYNPEHQAKAILHGLGFEDKHFDVPLASLSGGWQERAKLGRVLLTGQDLLILDEPTNHLDLEAVRWLEGFLRCRGGGLLFVVHDRVFLDNVATHLLYLGDEKPVFRKGNFGEFLAWHEEREKTKERTAARLVAEIERKKDYVRRFRAKARKASQAQSKLRQAERLQGELEQIVMEKRRRTLDFSLPAPARGDRVVAQASELAFAFPGKPPLWSAGLCFDLQRGQKIALVGPNGAGKSTLLKLLMGELAPAAGSISLSPQTRAGYFSQHRAESLRPENTVLAELRRLCDPRLTEETLMAALGLFLLGQDYFDRPVARLSGGEKARLSLAALFLSGANLLVLDEPTNHLDMESRQGLSEALAAFEGAVLMVAHDRQLLAEAADQLWEVGQDGLRVFETYADYAAALAAKDKPAESGCAVARPPAAKNEKDERRRKAEIRTRMGRELNPRKEAYASAESRLETLMVRQEELEATLAAPETYADTAVFLRLTAEYQQVKKDSELTMAAMERLEGEIAALERERDELLEGS